MNKNISSKYNTMEYSTPPLSKFLEDELDLAILESEDINNKTFTLKEILSTFKITQNA